MELLNHTRLVAAFTMATDPSGRDLLVVAIKGTFQIPPEHGAVLRLHEEQMPLTMSDEFFGEPGLSAPRYEVDFAAHKQFCDVLLNGTAHAPGGRPTERVTVGLSIGQLSKSFSVTGDRVWYADGRATSAAPFITQPISYDVAFGGVDQWHDDPAKHSAFPANPVGRGYYRNFDSRSLDGRPLPNTEELDAPVTAPDGNYQPMSFGAVGRHWEPRIRYAGTYDEHWLEEVFPFLPADFDERYYQAAPADQQIALPQSEQRIVLQNLTPAGYCEFVLPYLDAPVYIFPRSGGREDYSGRIDTLLIEPDLGRVIVTWRVTRPLRRNMFEIAQVLIGRKGPEFWQRRDRIDFPIPIVVEQTETVEAADDES